MNYTQNQKIEQVTESTLVLGVDIGSSEHYVRAFDYRGRELTRKVFRFSTDINGFNSFYDWVTQICIKHGKNEAIIGCEPTGHYWYTFYQFVKDHGMKLAFVNPASVKKAKELDDNSPKKTDLKDPKTIAKLVIDGRYSFPYVPEGIYAEIREVTSSRDRIMKELNAASNRIQRWLKIYFPEYLTVYKKFDTTTGMMILEEVPLPTMVTALGVDNIIKIWREHKVRGKGASFNRAKTLVDAAHDSVGKSGGYGVVTPTKEEIVLEEPQIVKHGSKYGVKIKASAPSIHMIRANISTEIAPIVGEEYQAKDLMDYIEQGSNQPGESMWDVNIFGKTLEQLVGDGMQTKALKMTDESQQKLQDTMEKIINESNGGLVCIII